MANKISREPTRLRAIPAVVSTAVVLLPSPAGVSRGVKAVPPQLDHEKSVPDLFDAIVGSAVEQVVANWQLAAETQDAAAIHQMRVGLRRLRTALRLFRTPKTRAAISAFDTRLAIIGRHLGEARDIDVIAGDVVPDYRSHGVDQGLDAICHVLRARRAALTPVLTHALTGRSAMAIRKTLSNPHRLRALYFDAELSHGAPLDLATHQLHRSYKRLNRRAKYIPQASIDELHRVRKAVKTMRYAFDFYGALYPTKRRVEFHDALARMQDTFGALNDLTLVENIVSIAADVARDPELRQAIGFLAGALAAKTKPMRKEARRAWRLVRSAKLVDEKFRL